MQQVYEETTDFRADFVQETFNKSLKKTLAEEGIVYFKKPRNMRWDYTLPEVKKMIINPQKAWLYVPREKAAYVKKAADIFASGTIMRFLSGIGKLQDDFQIAYAEPEATDRNGNYLLRLTPREKSYSLHAMNVTVDKNTYFIMQVSFEDFMGNTTTLKFSNLTRNTGLPDKLFKFQPPAGTNIFDMP
ncbi:MAG TPA: outer membrane lipoprotein carrier protein LolA [Smithellaceae bacterium]|nr:outer membrane lipoprotein carrier protein LolA [Smithellaceae bacterium]HRS89881.1 outer membrane lipoprotein carrier protein LolA [Smithellaceae bacterium]HRV26079.1 outer membrane lipoprotein carrier protein LolA [Smithellaceae bacterium]